MKQKVKEQKSEKTKAVKAYRPHFFFPVALIVVFVLLFAAIFLRATGRQEKSATVCPACQDSSRSILISTDKRAYLPGENIALAIENKGDKAIFLEPCKDIDVFEMKNDGGWVLKQDEKTVSSPDQSDFEKSSGNTKCQIDLPKYGPGTYRVVLPIYSNCTQPSRYACTESRMYRSGEFDVLNDSATIKPTAADASSYAGADESSTH
jgi:hypothetical protein